MKAIRTLILGGGFAGAYVARGLGKRGATVVSPQSYMLYTPLLAEVAAGAIEPGHVAVPLRMMCPHAEVVVGSAVALDMATRCVTVETKIGRVELEYEHAVVALGAIARMLPVPGLDEHSLRFKSLADAIHLRNHVLAKLDDADADLENASRHLTFVFVGAGYAGVEALAELMDLVRDSLPHYPKLADVRPRWVLVDAGPKILAEVPSGLGDYATSLLRKRGVDVRVSATLERVEAHTLTLTDGTTLDTDTVVWTAGVRPHPFVDQLGLPLDERGRIRVDSSLRVQGTSNVWALGDCARVPNKATPERPDPPTCQHALRQARHLARNLQGEPKPYRYRSVGQAATLGRDKGIADVAGLKLRGFPGSLFTRLYHVQQLPLLSRRLRVVADGTLSAVLGRDMAQLDALERPRAEGS
jgi:NADH:ubiquinone reductase (H+-translocating)